MKHLQRYNESIRDKMIPKSREEMIAAVKNIKDLTDRYEKVWDMKLPGKDFFNSREIEWLMDYQGDLELKLEALWKINIDLVDYFGEEELKKKLDEMNLRQYMYCVNKFKLPFDKKQLTREVVEEYFYNDDNDSLEYKKEFLASHGVNFNDPKIYDMDEIMKRINK